MNEGEKDAIEVLKSKNFKIGKKQRDYDFDAWKNGKHYVVEVKSSYEKKEREMIMGLSLYQMKTLADYHRKGSKALLMFVIRDKCSIFELVEDIISVPKTSQK